MHATRKLAHFLRSYRLWAILAPLLMMLLRVMVRAPLLMVGSLIMAILTSPQLALLFVGLIPIVLLFLI